jgi:hypothetical protein
LEVKLLKNTRSIDTIGRPIELKIKDDIQITNETSAKVVISN